MTNGELALSILTKFIQGEDDWAGTTYVAVYKGSACLDGWVENLTPDEVGLLLQLGGRWDA